MSDAPFSKEQVAALEKILGVKLPEQGFTLEITPSGPEQLSDAQVDGVAGGIVIHGNVAPLQEAGLIDPVRLRWSCKI